MISFPCAKINIGLNIINKRIDGFHNIETIFYPVGLSDILEIVKSDTFSFTSTGIELDSDEQNNLCVKAYQLLKMEYDLTPVKIHLHKIIPAGAGLGGGSSDAAHTLKTLNIIFELNLSDNRLMECAALLGSDCSFFINSNPSLGTEKGNVLQKINCSLKGYYLILLVPPVHVSTAMAYSKVVPSVPEFYLKDLHTISVSDWKKYVKNDFEKSVFSQFPEIEKLKNKLYRLGAEYASMSGSGSSVYGLFKELPQNNFNDCFVLTEQLQ
jgi:4-diphosphocytidyl-2-C-methyl-D-erythritol kinase